MDTNQENSRFLTTRSGYLANSETKLQKLTKAIGEPITPKQLTEQMARLNAMFGYPKDRTPDQARVMANEWFKALRGFGDRTVVEAVSKAIATCKWWPSLAEIVEICRNADESWREAIGVTEPIGGPKKFSEPQEPDLTPAEVSKRIASVNKWKQQYGFNKTDEIRIGDESDTRASQEMTVSSALLRSCAVRRSRGLKTCSSTCSRVNCELKDCEA